MEKILIKNENGNQVEVEVVRYFEINSNKYFVYSMGEKDAQGYITLYIDKIGPNVITDEEWINIKGVFGGLVKANRENAPVAVNDLDYSNTEISVKKDKEFKLLPNAYDLLGANKKKFEEPAFKEFNNVTTLDELIGSNNNELDVNPTVQAETAANLNEETISNTQSELNIASENDLSANSSVPEAPTVGPSEVSAPQPDLVPNTDNTDYKKLYEEQLVEIEKLQNELNSYVEKINAIKKIFE